MGILSHFNAVLRTKYPDLNVKIRIEQDDLIVRMVIDTVEGTREIVEEALDRYMEIVRGNERVEDLLPDATAALEMRHVLQMMRMTIEHQRDIIQLQRREIDQAGDRELRQSGQFLAIMNNQQYLLTHVGDTIASARDDAREWRELIVEEIKTASTELKHALLVIDHVVERQHVQSETEVRAALDRIADERPGFLEKIHAKIRDAALSGVVGNSFYSFLIYLMGTAPKA